MPERVEREAGERVPFDIFEKERLPLALREAPNMPMPLHSMASPFARGADALDCRTFGLDIGEQMTHPWVHRQPGALGVRFRDAGQCVVGALSLL